MLTAIMKRIKTLLTGVQDMNWTASDVDALVLELSGKWNTSSLPLLPGQL